MSGGLTIDEAKARLASFANLEGNELKAAISDLVRNTSLDQVPGFEPGAHHGGTRSLVRDCRVRVRTLSR